MILDYDIEDKDLGWFGSAVEIQQKGNKFIGIEDGKIVRGVSGNTIEEFKANFEAKMRKKYNDFEWVE